MSDFDSAVEALQRLSCEQRILALAESVKRDREVNVQKNEADARATGDQNRSSMGHEASDNGATLPSSNLLPDL